MLQLLKNPTEPIFMNLISNAKSDVVLCAPFIKKEVITKILEIKNSNTRLRVITTASLPSFIRKASDIEAIELLLENNIKVYNHQHLHAKVYFFDTREAIITSANLTFNGLYRNYEYGILIDDQDAIMAIDDDLQCLIDDDLSGEFSSDSVDFIKEQICLYNNNEYKIYADDCGDEIIQTPVDIVTSSLKSWEKDIYEIIENNMNDEFRLPEIYEYEELLRIKHPNNNNIRPKIRQILQQLRDKGIIKFLEPGVYKKLVSR